MKDDYTSVPRCLGGFGEINFGKQCKPGNRVYDSRCVAMCCMSNSMGYMGGASYMYLVIENDIERKDKDCKK